jgi:hypothetical protein
MTTPAHARVSPEGDRAVQFLLERPHPCTRRKPNEALFPFVLWVIPEKRSIYPGECDCKMVYRVTPQSTREAEAHFGIPYNKPGYVCNCCGRLIE